MDELNKGHKLSKGIKLADLLKETEFQIDVDYSKKREITCEEDFFSDDEENSSDDVLKILDQNTKAMMLESPDYHSFSELAMEMIDCVPNGDVKMMILEEGPGPLVPADAEVSIHYAAYWENDKIPFDSSLAKNTGRPTRITLGVNEVLPGLEIGLSCVKGPKARLLLLLQPRATWGPLGVLPRLRPEPALFTVALYDVTDVRADVRFFQLPKEVQHKFEVTIETVNTLHAVAKNLFSKEKYKEAINNYEQSIAVLNLSKPNDTEIREVIDLKIKTCVNLAVCFCKVNAPKQVINVCESLEMLTDINKHCKALFCLSKAYETLGKTDKAVKYYKKALGLEPRNKDIGNALAKLDIAEKKGEGEVKRMWQAAFKCTPVEKQKLNVDDDFVTNVTDMCESLARSEENAKFLLPPGLTKVEMNHIKVLCRGYKGLTVEEKSYGKQKRMEIIKVPDYSGMRNV